MGNNDDEQLNIENKDNIAESIGDPVLETVDADSETVADTEGQWVEEFKTDNDKLVPNTEVLAMAIEDTSVAGETVKKAQKQIKETKSAKGKWFTAVFFAINIFVLAGILVYQYNEFGVKEFDSFMVADGRKRYVVLAFIGFAFIMLFETLRNYMFILKSTKMHRPFLAYKSAAIHRYYDSVTPMSTGGQAFELMYLRSRGLRSATATSVPFAKLIINQIVFILLAITLLIISGLEIVSSAKFATVIALISLSILSTIVIFILFLSVSKIWAPKLILSILKLLQRCRIIRDYDATFKKIMRFVLEYQRSIRYYASSFWTLMVTLLSSFAIYLCKALIAFFIFCAFNGMNTAVFAEIFTKIILCDLVSKIIPLPGGSGASELTFTAMFIGLFDNGSIFWALLIWRILDYFAYLIQGGLILIYDFAIGNKINRKVLKRLQLEDIHEADLDEYSNMVEKNT